MRFRLNNIFMTLVVLLTLLCLASPAAALDIKTAKAKGLVGEMVSGYIGPIAETPSAEVSQLIAEINQKRKASYQAIAKKNGAELSVVEKLAAKKAFQKSPSGSFLEQADGSWGKKK